MDDIVYLNGEPVRRSEAKISALDYGFLYGFGLFETMRAYNGIVFRLNGHMERLEEAAELLDIPVNGVEIKKAILETIRANELADARVRLALSPGEGAINADLKSCRQPTVFIVTEEYKPYPQTIYARGFRAVVSKMRRNSMSFISGLKTTSYLQNVLAKQEAKGDGADETICLNENGLLAEASMSNIFLVEGGEMKTPRKENGILPGITRQAVMEMAFTMGVKCSECDLKPGELYRAQEAFLTNSLMEIMPLTMVNGKNIGNGEPGELTRRLMITYKETVIRENRGNAD